MKIKSTFEKIWEEHLGQVDGLSSEKVLQIIHNYLTKVSYDKGKRNINIDQPRSVISHGMVNFPNNA